MELVGVKALLETVENHHFRCVELINNKATHIGIVVHECGGVHKAHYLCDSGLIGHCLEELIHCPHTVVLNNDTLCTAVLEYLCEVLHGKVFLVLNDMDNDVLLGHTGDIVLLNTLLTNKEKCFLALVEASVL